MAQRFIEVDRATPYLLPPSVDEWVEGKHLARFVVDVVDQLNLSALESQYAGGGQKAYHPSLLVAVLFYGYATGVYSSRALERATHDSVAFRYLCANQHPDHDKGWRSVEVKNVAIQLHGDTALSMGNVSITDKSGKVTTVDKTWGYVRDDKGALRIVLHHSSLPVSK